MADVTFLKVDATSADPAARRALFADAVFSAREKLRAGNGSVRIAYQTPEEVSFLAQAMAELYPNPENALLGLLELLMNAVEHGNLGLGLEEKTVLLKAGRLDDEIDTRMHSPEWSSRLATLTLTRMEDRMVATIRDEGDGFLWQPYLLIDERRLTMPTGRGIALANMVCFDVLSYNECGNEVTATVFI